MKKKSRKFITMLCIIVFVIPTLLMLLFNDETPIPVGKSIESGSNKMVNN